MICLKDGAIMWWNGPERRFDDGGGSQLSGPPMVGGDYEEVPGETLWYKCTACKDWFPIPHGYTVIVEEDDQ